MTAKLDPPPVAPLSPSRRDDLRHRVMTATDPVARSTGHRRWAAPVIAVAAVGAVVAGTLVVSGQLGETGVQPAAGPSTPVSTPSATPPVSKPTVTPWLPKVDLGPVSPAEAARAAKACKLTGAQQVNALWSRRVAIPGTAGPKSGVVVLTKSTPGQPGGTYDEGIFTCFAQGAGAAVHDSDWKKRTTPSKPAVLLSGMGHVGGTGDRQSAYASSETLLRVNPRITRIESRYVWAKGQGRWTQGAVADGFAYTHSTAVIPPGQYQPTPDGESDLRQQYRAYDATGKPVPINP